MRKRRMIVIVNENYEVSTKFHGSTEEMKRCNHALTLHIREQAKAASILASAYTYTGETRERPASVTLSKEEYDNRRKELNQTKGATK